MKEILFIFLGGGIGSVLRYLTSGWLSGYSLHSFPLGTFVVNVVGCFLIGLFYNLSARWQLSPDIRVLLTTGLCGGFTTFSTFGHEALSLLRQSQYGMFGLYLALSLLIGIAFVFLGIRAGQLGYPLHEKLL